MLRPRIIPCLLVQNGGLVKTVRFATPKYVGDPINAVRIFNEKEVDELVVLDIDASAKGRAPDFKMIEDLAGECRMPLCYGGGVRSVEDAVRIFSLGVEKIALSTALVREPELIPELAARVGRQSVIAVLDVRFQPREQRHEIFINNGREATGFEAVQFAKRVEELGVGEIVINSIDRDGVMSGYDLILARRIYEEVTVPLTLLGGAGKLQDMGAAVREFGTIGVSAGSLFVFKGALRAVLINYPTPVAKDTLLKEYFTPTN